MIAHAVLPHGTACPKHAWHVQALEKLAQEHPQSCLSNGGLMAVLTYLDFFQTGVQRVAVNTAAAMCRGISRDATDTVVNAIPLLTPLLQYKVCCPSDGSAIA